MNNINHTIRKFNRFELKYVIDLNQAEKVKGALRKFLVPDEHGNNNGSYALSSLYYDSPDLRCYWEKENGIKFRRKLRIRSYETDQPFTDETPVFVEIKQRVDRVTQKRRIRLSYKDALILCNDRQIPEHTSENSPIMDEVFVFLWQYNLRPMNIVRYERQAFIGTQYDLGLRVTFDTSLSFQSYPLHLHETFSGLPMLSAEDVIMEVKANERVPYWLTDLIAVHNLKMVRVSKYCRSIDMARNMPSLQWRILPAESSQEVLSSSLSVFNVDELSPKDTLRRNSCTQ